MEWCVDERYPLPIQQTMHFTGSGIARFEPSTHQRYHGRRVVHLRIVKIVAPVTRAVPTLQIYDNYVPDKPVEGHLLTVRRDGKRPERWECDIDSSRPVASALRTLWDASRMSEG
jgi:hypothetical protein